MGPGSHKLYLRRFLLEDVESLLGLRVRNRRFAKPFEPLRAEGYYTLGGQKEAIETFTRHWEAGTGFSFGVFLPTDDPPSNGLLVGHVHLSNVVRGAWESCALGYFIDEGHNGRGLATEAAVLAVRFAFEEAALHRVQAAVMPRNAASVRVLEKSGFRREGFSERYLKIDGNWEDHLLYAVTREEWESRANKSP